MALRFSMVNFLLQKKIGLFVSVESKKPGRRGEKDRGMTSRQRDNLHGIRKASGLSICCDGQEDLDGLTREMLALLGV